MAPFIAAVLGMHSTIAWFNTGADTLAFCLELIRIYQEITRLNQRWHAYMQAQIKEYDAAYTSGCLYVPSTDIPLHPAAVAFTPWWRIVTCILLLIFALASVPNWKLPTLAWGRSVIFFNLHVPPYWQGIFEFWIALSWLGTLVVMPAGPKTGGINDGTLVWARYVSSWLLLGAGFDNITLGAMFGPALRVFRGQTFPNFVAPRALPGGRIKAVWPEIRKTLIVGGQNPMLGPVGPLLAEMDHAVSLL